MTSGSKPKRIVLYLILFFAALGVTLANATTEDNYKNDIILLPRTCETTLTENGYKANIIINPYTTGIYAKESNFNLDLTINPQGIGGAFTENNYKLDLIPENTLPDIRVPAHDVAVTNVTPSKTVIGQGYPMYINVTVENQGDFAETFNVTTYYDTNLVGDPQTVTDLEAGTDKTLAFTWDTTGVPYNNWTITANATILPRETDTDDNMRTCWVVVTISGDVNGDYIVDGSDLSDLNKAYGSTPNKPNWNPNCDFNDDYKVDASDLFELSKNYEKTV